MGCSSSEVGDYIGLMCSPYGSIEAYRAGKMREKVKEKIKLETRGLSTSTIFTKDPTIKNCSQLSSRLEVPKNFDLYIKIFEENDRLVPIFKKKLDELRSKQSSTVLMIGKADCGKPCYAYNRTLFNTCPECGREAKEIMENGTYKKQVLDRETGQYKWEEYYNEDNICLYFTFNEKIDQCDVDVSKMIEFYDKEDPEKKVHWSCTGDDNTDIEKDMPIHYMMIDGERFEFPYGLHMGEFFILNDWNLFPVPERGWKAQGACFSLFDENMHVKIGKSVGYYGINNLRMVIYYECVSCKLQYHIIRTSPLMNRDKSKDPK